jgi:hypothetical protein
MGAASVAFAPGRCILLGLEVLIVADSSGLSLYAFPVEEPEKPLGREVGPNSPVAAEGPFAQDSADSARPGSTHRPLSGLSKRERERVKAAWRSPQSRWEPGGAPEMAALSALSARRLSPVGNRPESLPRPPSSRKHPDTSPG